eukprot:458541-Pyramimonas_sp.AAC.1
MRRQKSPRSLSRVSKMRRAEPRHLLVHQSRRRRPSRPAHPFRLMPRISRALGSLRFALGGRSSLRLAK